MACEHERLRCTDGVFYCLDCGAKVDPPKVEKPLEGATEAATDGFERPSGRKIGFDAEKPKRGTRKLSAK
jgi:hypothetical protein